MLAPRRKAANRQPSRKLAAQPLLAPSASQMFRTATSHGQYARVSMPVLCHPAAPGTVAPVPRFPSGTRARLRTYRISGTLDPREHENFHIWMARKRGKHTGLARVVDQGGMRMRTVVTVAATLAALLALGGAAKAAGDAAKG